MTTTPAVRRGAVAAPPRPKAYLLSASVVLVLAGAGSAAGAVAMTGIAIPGASGVRAGLAGRSGFDETLLGVLAANVPVAASLAAGLVTFGAVSALFAVLLGVYLGATVAGSVNTVGAGPLLDSVGAYVGLEMLGLLLAGVAGMLPAAHVVLGMRGVRSSAWRRYLSALAPAAVLLGIGLALLAVGAVVEATVITASGSGLGER
ncbi:MULTISPECIES: hypothetical protein [Clavibacter]|uniref:hypothetical protein n=1 Tax=Clavibacter TaxID=1573 RepID=UPI0013FE2A51|nr:hypothetical protein [Clavibacter michiganensis]MBT1636935.1 hypothetical protein [Clavibacter michiganensis]